LQYGTAAAPAAKQRIGAAQGLLVPWQPQQHLVKLQWLLLPKMGHTLLLAKMGHTLLLAKMGHTLLLAKMGHTLLLAKMGHTLLLAMAMPW
jgi:hypothetical protein